MASPFETSIRLHVAHMTGPAAREFHIRTARAGLAAFMARQTTKPMVTLEVDHRSAQSETEVKPFGLIVYRFNRMREVVSFAFRALERLSPERSGAYRRAWLIVSAAAGPHASMAAATLGGIGLDQIGNARTVTIVNPVDYARKVHVGSKGFAVPAGIVEKVRQLINKTFGRIVRAWVQYIELSPGYRLRKAPRAGQALTYPALVIEAL